MIKLKKKNLILAAVGDKSLHKHWLSNSADYDVGLIYYGNNEGYEGDSEYYCRRKGFKYHLIQDFIEENPWVSFYEYVWLPDDDVQISPNDINRLFQTMRDYDLWLAQPSIMGYYGVKITLHQLGSLMRFTNWVEIMCPCFSAKALDVCKQVFKENNTGWSIETIWNVLLGHPQDKIAIIDDIIAIHTRAVGKGETYNKSKDAIAEAMEEAKRVYYKWNLDVEMEKDIKHGTLTGGDVYCSVVYKQFFKEMEDGIEKQDRFWPQSDFIKSSIDSLQVKR